MPKNAAASKPSSKRQTLRNVVLGVRRTWAFTRGILDLDPRTELNRAQRFLATNFRVLFMIVRLDVYKRVELHAQALTMKTLLALVPAVAVSFAISSSFGDGMETINSEIVEMVVSNLIASEELRQTLLDYFTGGDVQTARLGLFSIAILLVTIISLLNHIENTFNTLFGVTTVRPAGVRLLTYWALLTLGPILLGASVALTVSLQTSAFAEIVDQFGGLGRVAIKATPTCVTWLGFAALYFLVPNTRVRLLPAVLAAVVAGSLWNLGKYGFAWYVKTNVNVRDIYGSLAMFPMFILWLYISWLLLLLGVQLCFAFQNASTYRRDDTGEAATAHAVERGICRMFLEIAREFFFGQAPLHPETAAKRLAIPGRLLERITTSLRAGGYVRETEGGGLIPAIDLEKVTVDSLIAYVRDEVGLKPQFAKDPPRLFLDDLFTKIDAERKRLAGDVNFRDLAARFPPQTTEDMPPLVDSTHEANPNRVTPLR